MPDTKLTLSCLSDTLAICRLEMESEIPPWAVGGGFSSITRTAEELSVVCPQEAVPAGIRCAEGYRCFKVEGPLDLSLTGILASLTTVLAKADVSVFAVSTFDTDYLLIKQEQVAKTIAALKEAGHQMLQ